MMKLDSTKASFTGFYDVFGQEARVAEFISEKLSELFQLWGYERIKLSIIEEENSFSERIVGGSPWPEWNSKCSFTLNIDDYPSSYESHPLQARGLLVPEGTVSVSRWLAWQVRKWGNSVESAFPLKVFYVIPCFRNEPIEKLSQTKTRSFTQVGLEVIGASNCRADLEVITLITEGMKVLGIKAGNITVRLGDVRIFNALCKEIGVSPEDAILLKETLDMTAESRAGGKETDKEKKKIESLLSKYSPTEQQLRRWRLCLDWWRDELTTEEAEIIGCPESVSTLNYLATQMRNAGINSKIDLCVVRSHEYYTATVFEVDAKSENEIAVEVAGGGRYNKLIGNFLGEKMSIPATGFAFGLERLMQLFDNTKHARSVHHWLGNASADVVLYGSVERFLKVMNNAQKMRDSSLRVDVFIGDDLSEVAAECYAKAKGIIMEVVL